MTDLTAEYIMREGRSFVLECERDFEARLCAASSNLRDLIAERGARIVTLSGPTCSGKTTTAGRIIDDFAAHGLRVTVVSLDDFFLSQPPPGTIGADDELPDFDSVSALDLDCLRDFIDGVIAEKTVYMPIYDFHTRSRCRYDRLEAQSYDILLFEGIQAVYPQVTSLMGICPSASLYIRVGEGVTLCGEHFTPRGLRLLRRLSRDALHRSTSADFTLRIWRQVLRNEEENMIPYAECSDVQLSSMMPYGPCILRDGVLRLLDDLSGGDPHRVEADAISEKLRDLPSLPVEYLPAGSVFREFI